MRSIPHVPGTQALITGKWLKMLFACNSRPWLLGERESRVKSLNSKEERASTHEGGALTGTYSADTRSLALTPPYDTDAYRDTTD